MHIAKTVRLTPSEPTPPAAASVVQHVLTVLEDGKAEAPVVINLADKSTIADYMVIASGQSQRQVGALCSRLVESLKATFRLNSGVEGMPNADWVVLDIGDVIVHLFRPEIREFYQLEKMWGASFPEGEASASSSATFQESLAKSAPNIAGVGRGAGVSASMSSPTA
jgi:ribosome-associated protein